MPKTTEVSNTISEEAIHKSLNSTKLTGRWILHDLKKASVEKLFLNLVDGLTD